jgi:hypothetical protein
METIAKDAKLWSIKSQATVQASISPIIVDTSATIHSRFIRYESRLRGSYQATTENGQNVIKWKVCKGKLKIMDITSERDNVEKRNSGRRRDRSLSLCQKLEQKADAGNDL